jgi:hypothetical protein
MATPKTSQKVAKKASNTLRDGRTGAMTKSLAGSALTQSKSSKSTSPAQARNAAKTLASPCASKSAKQLAASVLSQSKHPFPVKTYKVAGSSLTQRASATVVRKVAKKMAK